MPPVLLFLLMCSIADSIPGMKRDADVPYLPYLQMDDAVRVLPRTSTDVDICSDPVEVPGELPFNNIRTSRLSVCENGVILTDPELLKSSLCVCRDVFDSCGDPGESLYLIAPFWSDVNNISATEETSISYQIFEEGNSSHAETLERIWHYIDSMVAGSKLFFPTWVMVAHWKNVHPYIGPNAIDSRTNTFQAVVATDGTQTYVIFTYNCSDLEWDRTNSFAAADCSFIGCYAGGNFNNYLSETDSHGLQIDRRTANISRASCSSEVTSWNNLLFFLTYQGIVNVTAREQQINAQLGDSVTMQFSISAFIVLDTTIDFWFSPQCLCGGPITYYTFTCSSTEHRITVMEGVEVTIFCSAARLSLTVANVTEQAFGDYIVSVITREANIILYSDTAFSNLTQLEEAQSEELLEKTSDPATLTSDDIASASTDLEQLQDIALTNQNVRQNYLQTIDNLMQADGNSLVRSQIGNQSSTKILQSLEKFTLQVDLPVNVTNQTFIFESYAFQLFDINDEKFKGQNISAHLGPRDAVKNVTIPVNISFSDDVEGNATVYVQVKDTGNDNTAHRLSVVAYRQENLFQNNTNGSGVTITSAVMSVTSSGSNPTLIIAFQPLRNATVEGSTDDGVEYQEVCSDFNTGGNGGRGSWSGDNCEEVPCSNSDSNYICCECHTFGHFGLLLAVTPVVLDEKFEVVLAVFSYVGAGISILSLTILLIIYILSKKLRSATSGKLLINLAISLLGVYIFFIVGGHIRPYGDTETVDIICGCSSALLQYFMLVYFGWTAAEALNLYFSLVKVFEAKTIGSYALKAGLIVWLVPLGVVIISAGAGYKYYISDVYCRPVEWPFYFAFVLPIAIILIFDCVMFVRIMTSLYKHTKQTAQLKDNKDKRKTLKQIRQNTRYAIVLLTLFGIGWIFGLIVTGYPEAPMAVTFTLQLIFCIFVSSQGFLLFLFQVVLSRDSREFGLKQLGKCFPFVKADTVSTTVPGKRKKTTRTVKNLFRAPKLSEEMMQSPEHVLTSTLERGSNVHSGITESFEASYQVSTLLQSGKDAPLTPTSPSSGGSSIFMENLTSDMTTGTFVNSQVDMDNLSLQDEI